MTLEVSSSRRCVDVGSSKTGSSSKLICSFIISKGTGLGSFSGGQIQADILVSECIGKTT